LNIILSTFIGIKFGQEIEKSDKDVESGSNNSGGDSSSSDEGDSFVSDADDKRDIERKLKEELGLSPRKKKSNTKLFEEKSTGEQPNNVPNTETEMEVSTNQSLETSNDSLSSSPSSSSVASQNLGLNVSRRCLDCKKTNLEKLKLIG
ncbi:hypothetical protein HK099_002717, partial [Clydaea vesicula]